MRYHMETNPHNMSNLFRQLGLPDEQRDIDAFVHTHRLQAHTALAEAPFWSAAQARFLTQSLAEDSDWSEVVDELAVRLG